MENDRTSQNRCFEFTAASEHERCLTTSEHFHKPSSEATSHSRQAVLSLKSFQRLFFQGADFFVKTLFSKNVCCFPVLEFYMHLQFNYF